MNTIEEVEHSYAHTVLCGYRLMLRPYNEFASQAIYMPNTALSIFGACSIEYKLISSTGKGWSTSGCSHATSVCAGQPTAQEGAYHQQEEALCAYIQGSALYLDTFVTCITEL